MSARYQVRIFESVEKDGAMVAGTKFGLCAFTFSLHADSVENAELLLRRDIEKGKHSRGRIYQICPSSAYGIMRSVAAALDGSFFHVFLDPVGPYSEVRRLRLPKPALAVEAELRAHGAQT